MSSCTRLAVEIVCRNLRLEIPTRLPNQPRPRLDEHCQGGATKRKPCAKRLVLFWTTLTGAVEPYNGRNEARRSQRLRMQIRKPLMAHIEQDHQGLIYAKRWSNQPAAHSLRTPFHLNNSRTRNSAVSGFMTERSRVRPKILACKRN